MFRVELPAMLSLMRIVPVISSSGFLPPNSCRTPIRSGGGGVGGRESERETDSQSKGVLKRNHGHNLSSP